MDIKNLYSADGSLIIGVDHGYKNIKTKNCIFKTSIMEIDSVPDDKTKILEYGNKVYSLDGKKVSYIDTRVKAQSEEFYLLTLAALGHELSLRGRTKGKVILAVGLPFRWYDAQKKEFKDMLSKNKGLEFAFEGIKYDLELMDVKVYTQGTAALAPVINKLKEERYAVIVDIGGGTIDIIPMEFGRPLRSECKIIQESTIYLLNSIREKINARFYEDIREDDIIDIITNCNNAANRKDEITIFIKSELEQFSSELIKKLEEYGINVKRSPIYFVGGGASIVKNFGVSDDNFYFYDNIRANAAGYEVITYSLLRKKN